MLRIVAVALERVLYREGHGKQYPSSPGAPDQTLPVSILQLPLQEPLFLSPSGSSQTPLVFLSAPFPSYRSAARGFPLNNVLRASTFCVTPLATALAVASQVILQRLHYISVTK